MKFGSIHALEAQRQRDIVDGWHAVAALLDLLRQDYQSQITSLNVRCEILCAECNRVKNENAELRASIARLEVHHAEVDGRSPESAA